MKYIAGFLFACSVGLNACFLFSLKRYQIEIREQKRYKDEKIAYYEYWSFTFPRAINVPDTTLKETQYTRVMIGDAFSDTTLPERNYYVQFSHN